MENETKRAEACKKHNDLVFKNEIWWKRVRRDLFVERSARGKSIIRNRFIRQYPCCFIQPKTSASQKEKP